MSGMLRHNTPPPTDSTVARTAHAPGRDVMRHQCGTLHENWYIAATSRQVTSKRPFASTVLEEPLVLFRGRNGKASWVLFSEESEQIVDVRGSISSDEMEFVLRAAVAGAGIAALPSQLAREPLMRQELEVVLPRHHLRGADLHVVLPSKAFVPARVLLFRDHLVRELTRMMEAAATQCAGHRPPASRTTASARTGPRRRRYH